MDRRNLLFSASAFGLLLAAPTAAVALEKIAPIADHGVSAREIEILVDIDRAIDNLKNFMFMVTEDKVILGVGDEPRDVKEIRFALHRLILDEKDREVTARVGLVNTIHDRLGERPGMETYSRQIVWLHNNRPGVRMSPGVRMCAGYGGLLGVALELQPTLLG